MERREVRRGRKVGWKEDVLNTVKVMEGEESK